MLLTRPLRVLVACTLLCAFLYVFRRISGPASTGNGGRGRFVPWVKQEERFPVKEFLALPTDTASNVPQIQHVFEPETETAKNLRLQRRDAVKEAFIHAWSGYKTHAWGKDEVAPITGYYRNAFGGWGATLVDTMDTLWMMGMKEDFEECVKMVERIDFTMNDLVVLNVFETTIRYLGGLLAAYDLSEGQYPVLLSKAIELGDMIYSAFDTPNRMPATRWEWQKSALGLPIEAPQAALIAEIGSLSLEFTRLTQLTKDPKYFDAIQRISDTLEAAQAKTAIPGLWPVVINAKSLTFDYNLFTLGGMADSTYEYLPKQHLLLGGRTDQYRRMYQSAIDTAKKYLFFRPLVPTDQEILFSGNAKVGSDHKPALDPQGQHLACFAGGMVGLGAKAFDRPEDMKIARQLTEACVWAYEALPSRLMPETFHVLPCQVGVGAEEESTKCSWDERAWHNGILHYNTDSDPTKPPPQSAEPFIQSQGLPPGFTDIGDARYILRPEAMESLFILYRLTGDSRYANSAWNMFTAIVNATETPIAHAGLRDVRKNAGEQDAAVDKDAWKSNLDDRMESFWTAETLKYAYLTFEEPSVIDLGKWVLNTEAHPFKLETS